MPRFPRTAPLLPAASLALSALALGSAGCAAEWPAPDEPTPNVCGGAICFEPKRTAVTRWGDGDVHVATWRADATATAHACASPKVGPAPVGGSMIELRLRWPKPGARLPVLSRERAAASPTGASDDSDQAQETARASGFATVRAVRIEAETGRVVADEEAVSGTATVLDVDSESGRVRVRVRAKWSSGVVGELLLEVDGPQPCAEAS